MLESKQLLTEAINKVEGLTEDSKTQMVESLNELTLVLAENLFNERKAAIEEEHAQSFESLSESFEENLEENFNTALTEAAVEFMEQNQEKFDAALKVDLAESFLTGLTQLVKDHGVLISPEINDLQETFNDRESQYIAEIERLEDLEESLSKRVFELEKTIVLKEAVQKLTLLKQEKVATLAENLNSKDIESFRQSVTNIVEALSKDKKVQEEDDEDEDEDDEKKVNESQTPGQLYAAMFKK